MQHLDEGLLQAWHDRPLSGMSADEAQAIERHLATCAECSSRAEELERETVEMASFFGAVRPSADVLPEYSVVVAPARKSRHVAARTHIRRLSWAASVIVALGVGWLAGNAERGPVPRLPGVPVPPPRTSAPVQR